MRRVKFQEGGQARSGVTNEPVGQNFRRLLQRMIEPSAPSAEPSQRPLERARRTQRSSNPPAAPSRPPASGANFPGETVQPAPPRGEDRQAFMERTMREEDDRTAAARQSAQRPNRPAAPRRPAPARQREMTPEERHAFMVRTMQEEADREAAARRSERGFFERLGLRRTNETGMEPGTIEHRRNYLGSGATDTNVSMNKKGGMIKAYQEGGSVRSTKYVDEEQQGKAYSPMRAKLGQGLRSPVANREREKETTQNYGGRPMRSTTRTARELFDNLSMTNNSGTGLARNAAEQLRKAREMPAGTEYADEYKKGGAVKPKAKTAMKKGGAVKKAAGGKVAAPKKMMKGGMTSKPKKMMGGGKAMYAKGGMAKGCK